MQALHASPPPPDASELFIGRDSSERKRAEAALRQREAILEATAFMAERLIQTRSWHTCIDDVLARLGQATGVSRVYIFENHTAPDGTALASQRFEWAAPGVPPQIDNPDLQGLPWVEAGFARWYEHLCLGKPIVGATETFPEDEAAFLRAQDIRSLAIVPISLEETTWGLIGFDDCREPRTWSEGEVEALKAVAHMLGVAIGRARDEHALAASEARYRDLVDSLQDVLFTLDTDGHILSLNPAFETLTGWTPGAWIDKSFLPLIHVEDRDKALKMVPRMFRRMLAGAPMPAYTLRIRRKDDTQRTVEFITTPTLESGAMTGIRGIARDVTTQQQAQRALQRYARELEGAKVQAEAAAQAKSEFLANMSHEIRFSVEDTGIGIPRHRLGRLFEPFTQVDASTTRKYGGTGLGLTICKRLTEMMGGHIAVESQEGAGSTFHFTISAAAAPSTVRIFLRAEQPLLQGRRVLIVDDNATNRQILRRLTDKWGMTPVVASSGEEALRELGRQLPFDVILLDMEMPAIDGLVLAKTIQQRGQPAPGLVLLTSINQEHSLRQRAREAGIAALLYKPLKPEQLHNVLTGLFDGAAERTTSLHPPALTSEAAPENPAARHPLRILLADDNLFNQKVALRMLERLCYQADVAANGLEVLDALHRQPYDVILMDVQMPEMDGLEATRRIRAGFPDDAQPVIIAMTAGVMAGDCEACLAAGMDDYISKPIQLAEIEVLLQSLTAAREAAPAQGVADAASVDAYLLALEARMQELADTSDPGFLCELLQEYQASAQALLAQLEAGVAAGSSKAVCFAAHSLKSSCAMVAADTLWAMCIEIEEHGRNDNLAQAGALFRQIKQHAAHFLRLSAAAIARLRASGM